MAKRDSYIKGASLLALGMFIAKVLGAVYRIPLTNIIGAEGIGIYQLVFPVYALLITVTGSGIPLTLSRLIAEKRIEGQSAKAMFRQSAVIFLVIGIIASLLLYLIANVIGRIQNNPYVAMGYKLIAPAIFLSTGIAAIRGWFQGNMNMLPSSISQVTEQFVKLVLGLVFAAILIPRGIQYAVWGAIGAISVSELIALIILLIQYYVLNRKAPINPLPEVIGNNRISTLRQVMAVMVPITLGGLMLPLVHFIDSLVIINLLGARGYTTETATGMYGILTGPVGSLINMPVVLTLAFAVTAIPVVSSSRVNRDINSIRAKSAMSVKLSFVIGVPSALALYALALPIMNVLYPNLSNTEVSLAAGLLKVTSFSIILLSIMQIFTALLQATDKAYTPFINMAIGSAVKVALTIILVRTYGIYGAAISTIAAYSVVSVLNIIAFMRWTGKNEKLSKNISSILLSGVIMGLAIMFIASVLKAGSLVVLIVGSISGIIIYGVLLVLMNTFSIEELKGMPLSSVFIKVTEMVRFWEKSDDKGSGTG